MPIAIVLRTAKTKSLFRDAIISTIATGAGNRALICSGFFQENFRGSLYQASLEPGLSGALIANSVQLDTVGIHNNTWNPSYVNFCKNLTAAGVTVVPYLMSGFQWHAKVFLLKDAGTQIFGIVGSSNLTANAFGVSNTPPRATDSPFPPARFNFECDVYFWNAANAKISTALNGLISTEPIRQQVILTQYDASENLDRSIEERLSEIEQQIWNSGEIRTLF